MRESRSSGSVEGVISNGHSYSDSGQAGRVPAQVVRGRAGGLAPAPGPV